MKQNRFTLLIDDVFVVFMAIVDSTNGALGSDLGIVVTSKITYK